MSERTPLVSVIIPAYNCSKYIEEAVNSMLQQDYNNLEVIVIDDGSSDDTWQKLKRIQDDRLILLKNETNLRIAETLNCGLKLARGKYLARMDGDDYSYPHRISKQVKFMETHPHTVVLGGEIEICDGEMRYLNTRCYPYTDKLIREKIFFYNPFAHPAVMIRASVMKNIQYELNWAEDYDMWFRLGRLGKFANLHDTVLKLRTHKDSVSQSKLAYQEKLTLYIRLKAVFEYGYKMSIKDKIYFIAQFIGIYTIPARIKFRLFSLIRGKK